MKAATLFSGIGAPEVAMPSWDWIWHAEIEPFPAAVMAARHPQSVNLGDVTADDFLTRALTIGRLDVLVFGSPCQSYSVAGKRLGLDDPRGNLALVALGLVRELRPAWFVFENVPGLFSSWSGGPQGHAGLEVRRDDPSTYDREFTESSDFAAFLCGVSDIRYSSAWTVLDAQYFGVAQRRERVFVVGCPGADWRGPAAVLLEPESLCGHPPTREQAREDVTGTLSSRASAGGGLGTDFNLAGGVISQHLLAKGNSSHDDSKETYVVGTMPAAGGTERKHGHGWGQQEFESGYIQPVALAVNAKGGSGRIDAESETFVVAGTLGHHHGNVRSDQAWTGQLVTHTLRGEGFDAMEDGTGRGTPIIPVLAQTLITGGDGARGRIDPTNDTLIPVQQNGTNLGFDLPSLRRGDGGFTSGVPAVFDPNQITSLDNRSQPTPELSHTLPAKTNSPIAFQSNASFYGEAANDLSPTLQVQKQGGGGMPAVAFNWQSGGDGRGLKAQAQAQALSASQTPAVFAVQEAQTGVREYDTAGSLRANGPGHDPVGTRARDAMGVRRLMPVECERLQGFPDGHTAITYRKKPAADAPRYKAIGNSMAVPVIRWILERVAFVHAFQQSGAAK